MYKPQTNALSPPVRTCPRTRAGRRAWGSASPTGTGPTCLVACAISGLLYGEGSIDSVCGIGGAYVVVVGNEFLVGGSGGGVDIIYMVWGRSTTCVYVGTPTHPPSRAAAAEPDAIGAATAATGGAAAAAPVAGLLALLLLLLLGLGVVVRLLLGTAGCCGCCCGGGCCVPPPSPAPPPAGAAAVGAEPLLPMRPSPCLVFLFLLLLLLL